MKILTGTLTWNMPSLNIPSTFFLTRPVRRRPGFPGLNELHHTIHFDDEGRCRRRAYPWTDLPLIFDEGLELIWFVALVPGLQLALFKR